MDKIIKVILMLLLTINAVSADQANEIVIQDPQFKYLDYFSRSLSSSDYLYRIKVDLNADGIDDLFFSTTSEDNELSRRGMRMWYSYLSITGGGYRPAGSLDLNPSNVMLINLDDGKKALQTAEASKFSASITTYHVENQYKLIRKDKHLDEEEVERLHMPVSDEEAVVYQRQRDATNLERLDLKDVMTDEQLAKLKDKSSDYLHNRTMLRDHDDPERLMYIFEGQYSDIISSKDIQSIFVGIQEENASRLIAIDQIEEPIRGYILKRVEAWASDQALTTQQDKQELAQIQQWYEKWHDQYGMHRQMLKQYSGVSESSPARKRGIEAGIFTEDDHTGRMLAELKRLKEEAKKKKQNQSSSQDVKLAGQDLPEHVATQELATTQIAGMEFAKNRLWLYVTIVVVFLMLVVGVAFFMKRNIGIKS